MIFERFLILIDFNFGTIQERNPIKQCHIFIHQKPKDVRFFSKFLQTDLSSRWLTQTEKGDSLLDYELIITLLICPVSLPHDSRVPGGCLGCVKQQNSLFRKDRCFVFGCHLQPSHTHTETHTHAYTWVSPLNLLVMHYDECYVIPLILASRWLTLMNRGASICRSFPPPHKQPTKHRDAPSRLAGAL